MSSLCNNFCVVIFILISFRRITKHQHASVFAYEQELLLNSLDVKMNDDNNSA